MFAIYFSSGYNEKVVSCISAFGAPLIGFALVDACAIRLRFHDASADIMQYILVAVFAALVMAALIVLRAVCNVAVTDPYAELTSGGQGSSQDHYAQSSLDLENISFSIVAGFLVFKLAERLILGEQAFMRSSGAESDDEIMWLFIVAFISAGSSLLVCAMRLEVWSIWRSFLVEHSCLSSLAQLIGIPPRILDWLEGCCFMSAVWCLYGAVSWLFSRSSFTGLLGTDLLVGLLFAAFALSGAALITTLLVGLCQGVGGPSLLLPRSTTEHTCFFFLSALGLLAGLAWADCFIDAARDLAKAFPPHAHVAEAILCLSLAVFILPVWVFTIFPAQRYCAGEPTPRQKIVLSVRDQETILQSRSWRIPLTSSNISAAQVPPIRMTNRAFDAPNDPRTVVRSAQVLSTTADTIPQTIPPTLTNIPQTLPPGAPLAAMAPHGRHLGAAGGLLGTVGRPQAAAPSRPQAVQVKQWK
jgi:hypothetical protein